MEIVGRGTRPRVPAVAQGRATLPEIAGVVVCLWDDYGLNCVCERCKTSGFSGDWGRQVAFAVKAWEDAVRPLGKELIVRTWASGAERRESLLRYTNRYFLPGGKAALAPTKENIARVVVEKDAAIKLLEAAAEPIVHSVGSRNAPKSAMFAIYFSSKANITK